MSTRIIQVFKNADMRCGHLGLTTLAKSKKVHLESLDEGELAIFLNSRCDKMKVYGANDVFAYYRSPAGRIEMTMIQYIPRAFGGSGHINFNKALEEALEKLLRIRKTTSSPTVTPPEARV